MKKILSTFLMLSSVISFCSCEKMSTGNGAQVPSETSETVAEPETLSIPEDYNGVTSFYLDGGAWRMNLDEASRVYHAYDAGENTDDPEPVWFIEFDCAFYRLSTDFYCDSATSPQFFDYDRRYYSGPDLQWIQMCWLKVTKGWHFNEGIVTDAKTVFNSYGQLQHTQFTAKDDESRISFDGTIRHEGEDIFFKRTNSPTNKLEPICYPNGDLLDVDWYAEKPIAWDGGGMPLFFEYEDYPNYGITEKPRNATIYLSEYTLGWSELMDWRDSGVISKIEWLDEE